MTVKQGNIFGLLALLMWSSSALWPAMIVLFSVFLSDKSLTRYHIFSIILGTIGIIFLVSPDFDLRFISYFGFGHFLGLLAAITWGAYSVLAASMKKFSSHAVPISMFINAVIFIVVSLYI